MTTGLDNEAIELLRNHVDKMDNKYDNTKISKQLLDRIKIAEKESKLIVHESNLHDITRRLQPSRYADKKIVDHISTTLHYQYDVFFNYKNIDFYIHIMFETPTMDVEKYVRVIKWIVVLCLHDIKNEKAEVMNLDLYLSSVKKTIPVDFPNTILPIHINSGFCFHNQSMNICIFREEEWVKVLIHECFHAFNMDFHEEKISFLTLFQSTFFVESEFLVQESLVEFWARILNCALFTYTVQPNMSQGDFHKLFTLNLNMERIYSLVQASKLLKLFHLTFADIINPEKKHICRKIYKEKTNAFCYYVITSIMMNHFDKTIEWFDVHNTQLFYFDKSERQVIIFCHYLKQLASNPQLIETYERFNTGKIQKDNPLKMCLFDIQM